MNAVDRMRELVEAPEDSTLAHSIRVSLKDLSEFLVEYERLRAQVTELQARGTDLIQENRALRRTLVP
jgi:hypothetical protein